MEIYDVTLEDGGAIFVRAMNHDDAVLVAEKVSGKRTVDSGIIEMPGAGVTVWNAEAFL